MIGTIGKTGFCFIIFLSFNVYGQKSTFENRQQVILDYAADIYQVPVPNYSDPEKAYWPATIARYYKYGENDSLANAYISKEEFVNKIPFHFILVGMARLMPMFPDAPAIKKHKITYLKNVYNLSNSYNPWTGEGTENHVNMSRTSGYIFAELMEDYPEEFPGAAVWKAKMKEWLQWYAQKIYHYGTAEFNASTYGVYNVIGWLNLYDFARDEEVRSIAKAVLDYFAAEMALHYSYGLTGGSESRGAPAIDSNLADSDYLNWLWFGGAKFSVEDFLYRNPNNKRPLQTVHAATSSYRPHPLMQKLALKKIEKPAFYANSKPSYGFRYPSFIKQHYYISSNFTMGSAYYPYGAFTTAAYKNTTWKLVSPTVDGDFPQIVTGGGMFYDDMKGMIRNPWLQLAQHKNVLVQMNKMPKDAMQIYARMQDTISAWGKRWQRDFISRYGAKDVKITNESLFPVKVMKQGDISPKGNGSYITFSSLNHSVLHDSVLFAETDNLYLYIRAIGGNLEKIKDNSFATRADLGNLVGHVVEVFEKDEFSDFISFRRQIAGMVKLDRVGENEVTYLTYKGDKLRVKYGTSGSFIEPVYDWGYGPVEPQLYLTSPPYEQPFWPEGKGYGRLADWWVNGTPVDLSSKWPVYAGPGFIVNEGVMMLEDGEEKYIVDFTNTLPQFKYQPTSNDTIKFYGDNIRMLINPFGGNIIGLETGNAYNVNPLTWQLSREQMPSNNKEGAPFQGHFLCTGRWGAPTEGEIAMGVPHNGEASNSLWKITYNSDSLLQIHAVAQDDHMEILRNFRKGPVAGSFYVSENFTSTSTVLRINNIVQHVTLGPPFLNEETIILTNATEGFLQSHAWPDPTRYSYRWPKATDSLGKSFDLQYPNTQSNYVSTHIFSDTTAWVSAYDPISGNLLLYTWKTNEYPWLNLWNHQENEQLQALGLEFGTTGIGRSYNELLFNPKSIFRGYHSYSALDAGESINKNYTVYYLYIGKDKNIKQVNEVINQKLVLSY